VPANVQRRGGGIVSGRLSARRDKTRRGAEVFGSTGQTQICALHSVRSRRGAKAAPSRSRVLEGRSPRRDETRLSRRRCTMPPYALRLRKWKRMAPLVRYYALHSSGRRSRRELSLSSIRVYLRPSAAEKRGGIRSRPTFFTRGPRANPTRRDKTRRQCRTVRPQAPCTLDEGNDERRRRRRGVGVRGAKPPSWHAERRHAPCACDEGNGERRQRLRVFEE
jgi:hypothetical protein